LSEIGINIAESQELMQILMEADAVDFDSNSAVFVPIKKEYVEYCLEKMPRKLKCDPGPQRTIHAMTAKFFANTSFQRRR